MSCNYKIWFADRNWHPKKSDVTRSETGSKIAAAAILKIDITSYLRWGWTDLDEIWQHNAEWHAEYGDMVKIETGSRISIWLFFQTISS